MRLDVNHIDGSTPAAERTDLLEELRTGKGDGDEGPVCRILSNARVLTEGVDVPSLDAVLFLNSRSSTVDITQAVGRAMRTAPGKDKGYIIIPVVVPEDVDPRKKLAASDFQTVWEVVRALRSHDSRMEYYVSNASAWTKNAPLRVISCRLGRDVDNGGYDEQVQLQLQLQLSQEIASKVVETIGDKHMYPRWGAHAADICRQVQTRINHLIAKGGPADSSFQRFLAGIRDSIGDHVTFDQAQEMIAQHVVTIPVFDVMLAGSGFAEQNPVSQEIERLLETFRVLNVSFEEELRPLTRAYRQMEAAFTGAVTSAEKVDILREIYDEFFHSAMKETVKRVGIVYTPVEIVDFMVRSAAAICQKEFGRSIGSENLHILDPFAGTGTFLARLIEMKDEDGNYLIIPEDLDRKYKNEIHANEFILLAYYIAAIKIEEAKHNRDIEICDENVQYQPYKKIVLTDTLLTSPQQEAFDAFKENIQGRQEQDSTPITVILANPPWSAGEKRAGDDTAKIDYPRISKRVSNTYGIRHKVITNRGMGKSSGDLYIKGLRWASDRVLPNMQREDSPSIIGFVHPNSLAEGPSLAGVRAAIRDDFTDIYVIDLRGNANKAGEDRKQEGDNVFGKKTKTPVQITFLVRNPAKSLDQPAMLYVAQVPKYFTRHQKFEWLKTLRNITSPLLKIVPVTPEHHWLNLSDGTFGNMLPVCSSKNNPDAVIASHALGLATNLDNYVYSFNRDRLIQKALRLIKAYNDALEVVKNNSSKAFFEEATDRSRLDAIKWTDRLKTSLRQRRSIVFDERRVREVLYRPFTKLWLYEDDRILASVKRVSAMFPRAGDASDVETGGGVGEFSSPVPPTWPSSEPSRPRYTETSRQQEPLKLPGSSPDGDSDNQSGERGPIRDDGGNALAGPARNVGDQHGAGDPAPEVTGGGVGEFSSPVPPTRRSSESSLPGSSAISAEWGRSRRAGSFPDGGVDDDGSVEYGEGGGVGDGVASGFAYDGGRSADAGDPTSPVAGGGGREFILVNQTQQLPFAAFAAGVLFDLCATGRQTRGSPRRC